MAPMLVCKCRYRACTFVVLIRIRSVVPCKNSSGCTDVYCFAHYNSVCLFSPLQTTPKTHAFQIGNAAAMSITVADVYNGAGTEQLFGTTSDRPQQTDSVIFHLSEKYDENMMQDITSSTGDDCSSAGTDGRTYIIGDWRYMIHSIA